MIDITNMVLIYAADTALILDCYITFFRDHSIVWA